MQISSYRGTKKWPCFKAFLVEDLNAPRIVRYLGGDWTLLQPPSTTNMLLQIMLACRSQVSAPFVKGFVGTLSSRHKINMILRACCQCYALPATQDWK